MTTFQAFENSTMTFTEDMTQAASTAAQSPPLRSVTSYWQFGIFMNMFTYGTLFVLILGTINNVMALAVLLSRRMRATGTNFLCAALAVADMGMLYTSTLRFWIQFNSGMTVDIRGFNLHACRVHIYFTYLAVQLSPLTLTMITIERVISVCIPLHAKSVCTRGNAIKAWCLLATVLVGINMIAFPTVTYEQKLASSGHTCNYNDQVHDGWYMTNQILSSYFPCCAIFLGNGIIVYKLVAAERKRSANMQASEANSTTKDTTRMLLVVSLTFLLLTVPFSIYVNGQVHWPIDSPDPAVRARSMMAYAIVYFLFSLNNAINFLLYCAFGRKFRQALAAMLCCRSEKGPTGSSTRMSELSQSTSGPVKEKNGIARA